MRLPGRFLIQKPDNRFAAAEEDAGVTNALFSISPLTADFNNDGYPDLLHVNLNGPVKAFINNGGESNFLKVKLPDDLTSIGATVKVITGSGKTYTAPYISGEGLCSDQSHILVFGLGDEDKVKSVVIKYLSGSEKVLNKLNINTIVKVS